MDFERNLLCCEEEMVESPSTSRCSSSSSSHGGCRAIREASPSPSPPSPSPSPSSSCFHANSCYRYGAGFLSDKSNEEEEEEEEGTSIAFLMRKQGQLVPADSFCAELQAKHVLCHARCNAARWIVKAHYFFNFNPLTASLAVNYLDRYLGKSLALSWKPWMVELVTVACLSLAAKMEEVNVPALLDLQGCEGLEHAFEAKTVQRMEVNVMSALEWRLSSVTAPSFAHNAIDHLPLSLCLKNSLLRRSSELLLSSLAEAEFLDFEPSLVAATSISFALEEALPVQADQLKFLLFQYIPSDTERIRRCYVQMESSIVDPIVCGNVKSPTSPNTVVYDIEDTPLEDNTLNVDTIRPYNFFMDRMHFEEDMGLNPKRQRRS